MGGVCGLRYEIVQNNADGRKTKRFNLREIKFIVGVVESMKSINLHHHFPD
jgi:hypothetical protein